MLLTSCFQYSQEVTRRRKSRRAVNSLAFFHKKKRKDKNIKGKTGGKIRREEIQENFINTKRGTLTKSQKQKSQNEIKVVFGCKVCHVY